MESITSLSSAVVSSTPICPSSHVASGLSTSQMAPQLPVFRTIPNPRKRRALSELDVDLPRVLKLIRRDDYATKTPLEQLERQICCRFDVEPKEGWNDFRVMMFGTDVGLQKGRSKILEIVGDGSSSETDESTDGFPFLRLPLELQQMIIDRVECDVPELSREDGRPLLPLRLVNRQVQALVDRTLEMGPRRCFKERICLAETMSGKIRLGFPPIVSKVVVTFDQLDSLLRKISTDVPYGEGLPMKCETDVFLKCDYRADWCKRVMDLLLKHTHLEPGSLSVRGVLCEKEKFSQYVDSRPSLDRLIFEKPLSKEDVYNRADYMPCFVVNFADLGPQFDAPQNVRKGYTVAFTYSRYPLYTDPLHQASF